MSQTWVIKDTAPVDPNEYFAAVSINFTSNNESFTSLGVVDGGSTCELQYNGVTYAGVDLQDPNSGPEYNFEWDNNAYKTIIFNTAPTGELLAWLQKNADKQVEPEYLTLKSELTLVADAIRAKGGTSAPLVYPNGFVTAIQAIQTGGGTTSGAPGDITFYDYDGTIVTSWTLEELVTKTALPDYPSHEGLTCQGWNWSLADLKTTNCKMNVGAMYITDDGKTRVYIRLEKGRTSPMLGVCPNGTVTVDWGDGTTPDTLTGTSTTVVKWTPNHAYTAPGDYVIKLTVNGTMGFYGSSSEGQYGAIFRYSSDSDTRNYVYQNSVQKIEIGNGVTSIGGSAFNGCISLVSITIPNSVTKIDGYVFYHCRALASITIPNSITNIYGYVFYGCSSLVSVTIPNSVTNIYSYVLAYCDSLASITIPNSVISIGDAMFNNCSSLASITISNSVTKIGGSAFKGCQSLASITIPKDVTSIGYSMFYNCYGVAFYDFTACTTVPTLTNTNAFTGISADCEIRVPASLVDAWKAATNWSTYADHIVGV